MVQTSRQFINLRDTGYYPIQLTKSCLTPNGTIENRELKKELKVSAGRDHVKHRARRNCTRSEPFPEDNPQGRRRRLAKSGRVKGPSISRSLDFESFHDSKLAIRTSELINIFTTHLVQVRKTSSASSPFSSQQSSFHLQWLRKNLRSSHVDHTTRDFRCTRASDDSPRIGNSERNQGDDRTIR